MFYCNHIYCMESETFVLLFVISSTQWCTRILVHSGQIYNEQKLWNYDSYNISLVCSHVHQRRYFQSVLLTRTLGRSWAGRWKLWLKHPWAMVGVSAKCRRRLPCCLCFTWGDKLLVQSHYRGLHSGCLSKHGPLSLSVQFSHWLSAYLSFSKSLCVPPPPHSSCILMNPFSHFISIALQPLLNYSLQFRK